MVGLRIARVLPLATGLTLVACAGVYMAGGPRDSSPDTGDVEGPPTLGSLPEMRRADAEDADRQHRALLVAREVLDSRVPDAPADRTYDALQRWAQGPVADWIQQHRSDLESALRHFRPGQGASLEDQVLEQAVAALLHEDTARQLSQLPSPSELDTEPEVAEMYRQLVAFQAEPFASSALLAYRACADAAYGGGSALRHWGDFCAARFERLKAHTLAQREAATTAPVQQE